MTAYGAIQQSGKITYVLSPSTSIAIVDVNLGSITGGSSGTQTFSNVINIVIAKTGAVSLNFALSGTLSDFSAFSLKLSNTGGPFGTLSLTQQSLTVATDGPRQIQLNYDVTFTANDGISNPSGSVVLTISA